MNQPAPIITDSQTATDTAKLLSCLQRFTQVDKELAAQRITALTPDASTRKYFRVPWNHATAVVALYAEPFDSATQPFLDVTRLFEQADLPVPNILAVDCENGIIVQEDLGDNQLIQVFESASADERETFIESAIDLIARVQATTEAAFDTNSIASRLAFDEEKLTWELNYFAEHYFKSLRARPLAASHTVREELMEVARELAARPRVLCHRDLHGANIIVDTLKQLRLIDYQDARMGAASYDLVTLLIDRQLAPPSLAEVRERRLHFLERRRHHGLSAIDPDDFAREFRLTTIQRGLKAIGSFSYLTAVNGRGEIYEKYINPQFQLVLQSAAWLNRFPHLQQTITRELETSE